jgi:integrase
VRAKKAGFSRAWMLRFKFRGEETRILLGHFPQTSLEAARKLAGHYRELASTGIDPRRARPRRIKRESALPVSAAVATAGSAHSIEYLASEFLERYIKPHRKRPEYVDSILRRDVLPEWKGRDARTIKPREVIELLDKIVGRGSAVMANRVAALLGQLFKFGIHRAIVETTPVQLLMRPGGKEQPKQRTLSDEELKAFLRDPVAATRYQRLARVLLILLLTGQRRGELTVARWQDVDLKARVWTIPAAVAKNGRELAVPLSQWAIDEFRRLKAAAGRSPWVLPGKDSTEHVEPKLLTRGVAKCAKRFSELGIKPFTLHDLRRTCRTGLARLKVEPHIAERVLGHAQERIQATYDTHAYLEEKRAALEKWEAHLQGLAK